MPTRHDAFISDSHRADGRLAKAIEDGIERLAKPLLRLRACDVFRDETSLAANPSLWAGILDHLGGSEWFVLLACPESANSEWCTKETIFWLENRPLERMLVVWTGGDLSWSGAARDFDWTTPFVFGPKLTWSATTASRECRWPSRSQVCWRRRPSTSRKSPFALCCASASPALP
jgi:hypothetical protein